MFCPQCREVWPKGVASTPDKSKASANQSSGKRVIICPNCRVPLATDRIQGEFPSVAHASSLKDGSITVNDILRESSCGVVDTGETPLDDVKERRFHLFDRDQTGKLAVSSEAKKFFRRQGGGGMRLAIILATLLFVSTAVSFILQHPASRRTGRLAVMAPAARQPASLLSSFHSDVSMLMPRSVGKWTRLESNSQVNQEIKSAGAVAEAVASTYKTGGQHVELWVTNEFAGGSKDPLSLLVASAMTIHTDRGIVNIAPHLTNFDGMRRVAFDYTPKSKTDWIQPGGALNIALPHMMSWYQSPYVVTVASNNKEDTDSFVEDLVKQTR